MSKPVVGYIPQKAVVYKFTVTHGTTESSSFNAHLEASYFVEDGSYTLFKDTRHGAVEAFRTDSVIRITRGSAIDDAS